MRNDKKNKHCQVKSTKQKGEIKVLKLKLYATEICTHSN